LYRTNSEDVGPRREPTLKVRKSVADPFSEIMKTRARSDLNSKKKKICETHRKRERGAGLMHPE